MTEALHQQSGSPMLGRMNDAYFDKLSRRAVAPDSVRAKGPLTEPKTYGVFELPATSGAVRRFRMGSYPIRLIELEQEFKRCKLLFLFRVRPDAVAMAGLLNARNA